MDCTAHDITWDGLSYQCLNCGATATHSWDIKHVPQPKTTCLRCEGRGYVPTTPQTYDELKVSRDRWIKAANKKHIACR